MLPEGAIPAMTLKVGNGTVYIIAPIDQSPERIAKVKADIERACQPILMEMAQRESVDRPA
ncbi:hypothetical protein JCM15765_08840 [Paradesulfitobacterium aromaticivorans]